MKTTIVFWQEAGVLGGRSELKSLPFKQAHNYDNRNSVQPINEIHPFNKGHGCLLDADFVISTWVTLEIVPSRSLQTPVLRKRTVSIDLHQQGVKLKWGDVGPTGASPFQRAAPNPDGIGQFRDGALLSLHVTEPLDFFFSF